jgi:E3 ubiquitin-protein ligase Topors
VVRARLRLRLKLESERTSLKHSRDESKAQELRRVLLEAKARRQAAETDATLRKMDRLERKAEVRRRLMVLKMMAAETEGERKQRELKEKLLGEKRRRMLRDLLLARKRESKGGAGQVVEIGKTEAIPTVAASAVAVA